MSAGAEALPEALPEAEAEAEAEADPSCWDAFCSQGSAEGTSRASWRVVPRRADSSNKLAFGLLRAHKNIPVGPLLHAVEGDVATDVTATVATKVAGKGVGAVVGLCPTSLGAPPSPSES